MLRTLRIDELPQIINILKWQMSWIGPRPEAEAAVGVVHEGNPVLPLPPRGEAGHQRLGAGQPGPCREVEDVHRKLQYDFYYIKYFSPWLDVLILFRTIKTMLTGWGAR